VGTNSLPDNLYVEFVYDLDNDLATFTWTMGNESGGATNVAIGDYTAEAVRNAYQPSGMTDTDFIKTDYLTVESIPEPATLGMIGLMTGTLLFIRRRFMI
jgi:membrane protein YqaA with SNARE-associated domain